MDHETDLIGDSKILYEMVYSSSYQNIGGKGTFNFYVYLFIYCLFVCLFLDTLYYVPLPIYAQEVSFRVATPL